MAHEFNVTTTATFQAPATGPSSPAGYPVGTVVLNDLGGRTLVHPTVDLNLVLEYPVSQIQGSVDLETALVNGWLTATDEFGNPIGPNEDPHALVEHTDVDFPTSQTEGDIITYNSTSGQWENKPLNLVVSQASAVALWDITHNLKRFPSVMTVDDFGNEIMGDVAYISNNRLTITFSVAVSGKAYLT